MTKEEIIKRGNEKFPQDIIEIINDDGSITRKDVNFNLRKAYIEGLIDNNISLPSNLDEAAEEWCKRNNKEIALCADKKSHYLVDGIDAFKACAEWMAGQGVTVGGTFHHSCGYPSVIELNTYLRDYEGKEVIVQIRKKQQPGESLKEKEDD